jgi:NADH-quinone oxidoreductase subunit G
MNVADLCPVGALTTKDFRFKIRVWFLEDVAGICTGCVNGCNVHIGVANNKVHRYQPRRNDEVNDTWLCDQGRMSYARIGSADRLREVQVLEDDGSRRVIPYRDALGIAANRLRELLDSKGAGVVAGIASAHATNEDLYVFRRLLDALGIETLGVVVVSGESDDLLVKSEKGANVAGARALGFDASGVVVDRIRTGALDGAIVLGHDLLDASHLDGIDALSRLDSVIALDSHQSNLQRVAHVSFPVRVAAEKHGTLTNVGGRVQRVQPAVEPAWEARSEGEVLAHLAAALGFEGFDEAWDPHAVSRALSESMPEFAGIDLDSLGPAGAPLQPASRGTWRSSA